MKITDAQAEIWAAEMLLSDRRNWCQRASAVNALGEPVLVDDPRARRWCQIGARGLVRADCDGWSGRDNVEAAITSAAAEQGYELGIRCNDKGGYAATMKMLARAFELAA